MPTSKRDREYPPESLHLEWTKQSLAEGDVFARKIRLTSSVHFYAEEVKSPNIALEKSLELFDIASNPKNATRVAALYRDEFHDYDHALFWFKVALDLKHDFDPVDTTTMFSIAQIYKDNIQDYHQAISWFEEALLYEDNGSWVAYAQATLEELYKELSLSANQDYVESYIALQKYNKAYGLG